MEKLNLRKNGEIKIEVNDDGEYIAINLADQSFVKRFYDMFMNIKKKYEEAQEKNEAIADNDVVGQLDFKIEVSKSVMLEIDNLFGEGTCKKVFGDIVPDMFAIKEFFEAITPIIQKFGNERNQRIAKKYSAGRRGAR